MRGHRHIAVYHLPGEKASPTSLLRDEYGRASAPEPLSLHHREALLCWSWPCLPGDSRKVRGTLGSATHQRRKLAAALSATSRSQAQLEALARLVANAGPGCAENARQQRTQVVFTVTHRGTTSIAVAAKMGGPDASAGVRKPMKAGAGAALARVMVELVRQDHSRHHHAPHWNARSTKYDCGR